MNNIIYNIQESVYLWQVCGDKTAPAGIDFCPCVTLLHQRFTCLSSFCCRRLVLSSSKVLKKKKNEDMILKTCLKHYGKMMLMTLTSLYLAFLR